MSEEQGMVGFYVDRIKSNISEQRFQLKKLGAELIRCPGLDSVLRADMAEHWLMACNRCEQIEEDIEKLEYHLPLGLLYKVKEEGDTDNEEEEERSNHE